MQYLFEKKFEKMAIYFWEDDGVKNIRYN